MAARLSGNTSAYSVQQNAEINVTPFVDVMLVLLIIFMVAAAVATSAVKVDLPVTPLNNTTQPLSPIAVSLTANGGIYVNDQPVTPDSLASTVSGLIADGTHDDRVEVRGDRAIRYERVMEAMSALSRGGISKLSLVSQEG